MTTVLADVTGMQRQLIRNTEKVKFLRGLVNFAPLRVLSPHHPIYDAAWIHHEPDASRFSVIK